jgi:hypothetical protein
MCLRGSRLPLISRVRTALTLDARIEFPQKLALVVGHEALGVSRERERSSIFRVFRNSNMWYVHSDGSGRARSVSAAGGIRLERQCVVSAYVFDVCCDRLHSLHCMNTAHTLHSLCEHHICINALTLRTHTQRCNRPAHTAPVRSVRLAARVDV